MRCHLLLNIFVKMVKNKKTSFTHIEGATPFYTTDSRSSILGLANEVSFVSKSYVVAV